MTSPSIGLYRGGSTPGNVVAMIAPNLLRPPTRLRLAGLSMDGRAPGVALSLAAAAVAAGINHFAPGVSPLIIAIILGMVVANTITVPERAAAGVMFSAKSLLRAGIVFLGLQVVLTDIADLGFPMLVVVVCIVGGGILTTVLMGRMLGMPPDLVLLIGCGFSICGAAAVAGAAGVIDADDQAEADTVTAVALVVIFGTLMIPLLPLAAHLAGLTPRNAGLWAGGSIHEIAQVVAAGGVIGGGALTVAVVVKLARVVLLAPVAAILSIRQRRRSRTALQADAATPADGGATPAGTKLPPLVPTFVIGFLAMVLLRTSVAVPVPLLRAGKDLQTVLLAAAMFALGCGVTVRGLRRVGLRPFVLATLSTVVVTSMALTGVMVSSSIG